MFFGENVAGRRPATFSQKHGLCPFRCLGCLGCLWCLGCGGTKTTRNITWGLVEKKKKAMFNPIQANFYLGQVYLGQVRLRPNFCFFRFRPFSGVVIVVVLCVVLCVVAKTQNPKDLNPEPHTLNP